MLHKFHRALPALLLAFCTTLSLAPADAAQRVALVIGNSGYALGSLDNPARDAALVEAALKEIGFDIVVARTDVALDEFRLQLARFREQAAGAEVAVFYFAGHGIESKAELARSRRCRAQVGTTACGEDHSGRGGGGRSIGADMRILVLDACRDNPSSRTAAEAWRAWRMTTF
jgi:hypothetical protein